MVFVINADNIYVYFDTFPFALSRAEAPHKATR